MKYVVQGITNPFDGQLNLQGSKNSMLNNLCIPLLTDDEVVISNVPRISDVLTNLNFLANLGAEINWISKSEISIRCKNIDNVLMHSDISVLTTGSKFFIPMMVARFGEYITGPSGGCDLGDRGFKYYVESIRNFGIESAPKGNGLIRFYKSDDYKTEYTLPFPSFGLTVNAILSAVSLGHKLILKNACQEPEIDNTIDMLKNMGADVERLNATKIVIAHRGTKKLFGCNFRNMSDRNAAVTYAALAIATGSRLYIKNYDDIKMIAFYRFLDEIGAAWDCQENILTIHPTINPLRSVRIKAFYYPNFHSDWQPLVSPILTQITGESVIEEHLFPNRLDLWSELNRMGARFSFINNIKTRFIDDMPHAVKIYGPVKLHGAKVCANNLRSGAALLIAAIAANGETIIRKAEEIDRGYDSIDSVLSSLGINIEKME